MGVDREKFDRWFRERIVVDGSDWRDHMINDRSRRDEFMRSQRAVTRILVFMDENDGWDMVRLSGEMGVPYDSLKLIFTGKENMPSDMIDKASSLLGIDMA